jgi:two-component sensor histidine kinase
LDVNRRLAGILPGWVISLVCAVLGVAAAVMLRAVTDLFAPGVAPYSFIYPAALFSTLLAGWQSGIGTALLSGWLAWKFVVPQSLQMGVPMRYQFAAAAIAAITATGIVAVGQAFRIASRRVVDERNAKLAERELLFRELQHRVNNDFAIVGSLLTLQRQKTQNEETRQALDEAMARVQSVSRVHRHIYALPDMNVDVQKYLNDLCDGLKSVLPRGVVTLSCQCEPAIMARDKALAVGLITNELITNAVKHAFPNGRTGTILVRFQRQGEGWRLSVKDDGAGMTGQPNQKGLGTGLIAQFVKQTQGIFRINGKDGTEAVLDIPAQSASV